MCYLFWDLVTLPRHGVLTCGGVHHHDHHRRRTASIHMRCLLNRSSRFYIVCSFAIALTMYHRIMIPAMRRNVDRASRSTRKAVRIGDDRWPFVREQGAASEHDFTSQQTLQ